MCKVKMLCTALALGLLASGALAADTTVYGSQLMTPQERVEYRTRMNAAKTAQEREQIRLDHHEQMQLRAKEKGATLPDNPPAQGAGASPMGRGMGRGAAVGQSR